MKCVSISETKEFLSPGKSSVVDHVQSVLTAIRETDEELGAFISVAGGEAMREAESADARIRERGPRAWEDQPLLGITVTVKDLIQTRDLPTTRGSLTRNGRPRSDAPVVARLRSAGAIVVGKTTTSEYGWSASTVSRVAAPTRNPWNPERTAGGSSGGAAAAVAAGLCTAALGTDGAGSVRIPAAFCGVVGYKPSLGHIPYVPAGAERLAHVGLLAGSVRDAVDLAAVAAGPHQDDPDSWVTALTSSRRPLPLRIGWIEFPGTAPEIRAVSERIWPLITGQGHRLDRIDVPFHDAYPALVDILAATEAAGTTQADEEWCDPGRLEIVRHGRTVSGVALMNAETVRMDLRRELRAIMHRYDLLAMATVPVEPFGFDAIAPPWAADPRDLQWLAWAPGCYPFNITGQPAISLPVGVTSSGLPVGVQLVGPFGGDDLLLSSAVCIERDLRSLPLTSDLVAKGR